MAFVRRVSVVAALGVLVSIAAVVPQAVGRRAAAASHHPCVRHPSDGPSGDRTLACIEQSNHSGIAVCDHDTDGHKTYGRYRLLYDQSTQSPDGYRLTAYDPDGSYGNCGHERYWSPISAYAVCVQYEGCSGWREP